MALLEAVAFPQEAHRRRLPCCRSTCCFLCGYGVDVVAGAFEGVKTGVVVQDGEDLTAAPPHDRMSANACCSWPVDAVGAVASWVGAGPVQPVLSAAVRPVQHGGVRRRWRRRRTDPRNAESQRLNHIVVERNRRRQMNQHLATLRGLMPRSYARRGDQASIVGGVINFVKELEYRLHSLHAQKRRYNTAGGGHRTEPFDSFFTFPQYSVRRGKDASSTEPGAADVEAAVSDGHATVKVMAPRRPGEQLLLRLLLGMQLRGLAALHLNVTATPGQMVLYTITFRMGDGCQLSSAGDVAAAVHDIVAGAN